MDMRALFESIEHILDEEGMEITYSFYSKEMKLQNVIEAMNPVTKQKCHIMIQSDKSE